MSVVVIDTNVPLVTNGEAEAAGGDCIHACLEALLDVTEGRKQLALDSGRRIIREYGNKLMPNGQPKPGNAFYKWVLTNFANPQSCHLIDLTTLEGDDQDFEEFPHSEDLKSFDPADRKFVAVAAAHPERPPIQQALDSKWLDWNPALAAAGIRVEFLCPREIGALAEPAPRRRLSAVRRRRG